MRIIAGMKKGMKLFEPQGDVSRPILDRVKQSVFDILFTYELPKGAIVADLFSGVGSLGLEALSRGAAFVTFIEMDPGIKATLEKNIAKMGPAAECKVIRANAFNVGAVVDRDRPKYNLVFVDPPYADTRDVGERSKLAGIMDVLSEQVTDDVLVLVRTHRATVLLDRYGCLAAIDRREWGKMAVTFLAKKRI